MTTKILMPSISFVVARSVPGNVIGCDNKLPWHLRTDMQNFKAITTGHVVIMGRKTHDSIGRALPNRINIVVSTRRSADSKDLYFVQRREDALFLADHFSIQRDLTDIFVIGGGAIYTEFRNLFNKVFLTEVRAKNISGDAFFDYKFGRDRWKLISRVDYPASDRDDFPFSIKIFERRRYKVRSRALAEFMKADSNLVEWEKSQLARSVKRVKIKHKVKGGSP